MSKLSLGYSNSEISEIEIKPECLVRPQIVYTNDSKQDVVITRALRHLPLHDYLYTQMMQGVNPATIPQNFSQKQISDVQLPFLNPEYAEFLPEPVENQWFFRFKNGQLIQHLNYSLDKFKFVFMTYPPQGCDCMRDDEPENYFSDHVVRDWHQYKDGIRVISSQFSIKKNIINFTDQNKPFLLLLHDFYQHPFCFANLINELDEKFNVVIPYMPDIMKISQRYVDEQILVQMTLNVGDILDLLIDNYIDDFKQDFSILAHGSSCQLAVCVSQEYKCKKMLLLNPSGNILPRPRPVKRQSSEKKLFYNKPPENSISANSEGGIITGVLNNNKIVVKDEEEIPIAQADRKKSFIRLSISRRQSYANNQGDDLQALAAAAAADIQTDNTGDNLTGQNSQSDNNHVLSLSPILESPSPSVRKRKSVILNNTDFQFQNPVLTKQVFEKQRKMSRHSESLVAGSESTIESVYELLNTQIPLLYTNPHVFFTISKICGLDYQNIKICTQMKQLFIRNVNKAQKNFMQYLPTLCTFCNLNILQQYRKNLQQFDKNFFLNIKNTSDILKIPVYLDLENTIILISSHSPLLNEQIVKNLCQIEEVYEKIQCRTILGSGHDLFDTAVEILVNMM